MLAAYKALKEGYKEGRSNTVVVFTDGANSKPGMSLETLKLELERATDPTRPVRVVLLGVGPDVRQQELAEIAAATGGRLRGHRPRADRQHLPAGPDPDQLTGKRPGRHGARCQGQKTRPPWATGSTSNRV